MLDETRASGARQLKTLALTLFLGGVILVIPAIALIERQGPWPLVVPLALAIGAVVALIAWAGVVVLSDQAVMDAARWQGYKRHLKQIAQRPRRRSADGRASAHAGVRGRARTGSAMVAVSQDGTRRPFRHGSRRSRRTRRMPRRRSRPSSPRGGASGAGGAGAGCRGRGRIRCRLRPDDCRNPPTAALIGSAGDRISASGRGARSAKTTAPTATPGNTFRTITRDRAPTAGTRTASPASAIAISTSASRSRSGTDRDPILKERLFGLTGHQGNHGEDVKECYFYLDSTPTHSYMKCPVQVPAGGVSVRARSSRKTARRGRDSIRSTSCSTRASSTRIAISTSSSSTRRRPPEDILIRITVENRGPEAGRPRCPPDALVPQSVVVDDGHAAPAAVASGCAAKARRSSTLDEPTYGQRYLYCEGAPELLFTENERTPSALFGVAKCARRT